MQNSSTSRFCAGSARLVSVVCLSASATVIGLIHSQPATGALILSQVAIQFIVTKSVEMSIDFRQPLGSSLSGYWVDAAGINPATGRRQTG